MSVEKMPWIRRCDCCGVVFKTRVLCCGCQPKEIVEERHELMERAEVKGLLEKNLAWPTSPLCRDCLLLHDVALAAKGLIQGIHSGSLPLDRVEETCQAWNKLTTALRVVGMEP